VEKPIRHIHKEFMKSKDTYLDTIKYWDKHVLNILKDPTNYKSWLNNKSKNGSLIIDGNPIYSLIKKDKSQALRIVQDEPRSRKPYMQAWTEIFDEEEGGENLPVLVIALELSNKTSMDSLSLIEHWFEKEKPKFDRLLASINKKYEKNYTKSDTEIRLEAYEKLKEITHAKVVGTNNEINTSALQHFYTLHTTWEKDYSKRIAELNTDLAKTISLYISTLFTLVKNSATLKAKKQASINITHRRSDAIIYKNYPVSGFQNIYFSITTELEKLNEDLIDGIEEDATIQR
jgi:hypothetical protein